MIIKILVECTDGWFQATAIDDTGTIGQSRDADKQLAIQRVKKLALSQLEDDPEFTVVDLKG